MKKYRLKKDTFLAKKGGLFREVNESGVVYLQRIKPDGSDLFTKIAKGPIINFDEWFEEAKEFEEWKPKEGEEYKWLSITGTIVRHARAVTDTIYNYNASIGNCYPLDTPDELIIKEQKLIPQAMHRLKMAAKKAWFEFNGSEGPDWEDGGQEKWYVYYGHGDREFTTSSNYFTQRSILPSFPTRSSCRAYAHKNLEDLKLLFGVEQ